MVRDGVRMGLLIAPLALAACGGGGGPSTCNSADLRVCAALRVAPGSTSNTPATTAGKAMFTTAPDSISLPTGTPTSYQIGGGTAPYTATSSNTAVVTSIVTGTTLTITRIASGIAQILVVDATGKSVAIGINASTIDTSLASPLFTTAPNTVTMIFGGNAAYAIGGGTAPYTANSSNTGVVTTSVSGTTVNVSSLSTGTAQIAVVDAVGKTVTIDVTVLAKGQAGNPPAIFPASITVGNCTTNIPFVFTGGTAPFTVFTGENYRVPVKSPLPLGQDSYFTASVDLLAALPPSNIPLPPPPIGPPYVTTLTVVDSQSRAATATVTVPSAFTCPKNTLLQVVSGSQNARVTEKTSFQISGGIGPYSAVSTDPSVATTPQNFSGTFFDVTALSTGGKSVGSTLIKVTSSDNQNVNLVFTVYPQP